MAKKEAGTEVEPKKPATVDEWLGQQVGVELAEVEGRRMISISPELEQKCNLLVPISQVVQIDRNFSPSPRLVRLDREADTYPVKGGARALNKVGLTKLADLASIEIVDQKFDYMGGTGVRAEVTARMRGSDGVWRYDTQAKTVRFEGLRRKVKREARANADDAEIEKRYDEELEFVDEKAASKAWLRCIRNLLSVKPEYSNAELNKPFFIIGFLFTPDYDSPAVQKLLELNYREASSDLYPEAENGEAEPPRQIERPVEEPEEQPYEGEAEQPVEEEAEVWDLDEEEADTGPRIPKPEAHFTPKSGPFAGKDVEEFVVTAEGQKWLADMYGRLKDEGKREQALLWLEWGSRGEVTAETVAELVEGE